MDFNPTETDPPFNFSMDGFISLVMLSESSRGILDLQSGTILWGREGEEERNLLPLYSVQDLFVARFVLTQCEVSQDSVVMLVLQFFEPGRTL